MNAPSKLAEMKSPAPREASLPAVRVGFFDLQGFELLQRVAKAFASSTLVPVHYQGNVANCMIALNLSERLRADALMVMQNLYIVHGSPGWSSKFLIASVNTCGRYESLRYEWRGEEGKPNYGCRAWTIERSTGEKLFGIWVDWKMVKAEGWDAKKGSKWLTMPDQMFVYRSAAFWQRAYAPEISMGLLTDDELRDTYDATKAPDGSYSVDLDSLRTPAPAGTAQAADHIDPDTGEIIDTMQDDGGSRAGHDQDDTDLRTVERGPVESEKTGSPEVTYAQVADKLNRAKDIDELGAAADLIQYVSDMGQRDELGNLYKQRNAELREPQPAQNRGRRERGNGSLGIE